MSAERCHGSIAAWIEGGEPGTGLTQQAPEGTHHPICELGPALAGLGDHAFHVHLRSGGENDFGIRRMGERDEVVAFLEHRPIARIIDAEIDGTHRLWVAWWSRIRPGVAARSQDDPEDPHRERKAPGASPLPNPVHGQRLGLCRRQPAVRTCFATMPMMTLSPEHLINRELSLLAFQERVFALSENRDLPLLERLKFVAIVAQNIDEFFQVRVSGLLNQAAGALQPQAPDGLTPTQQLDAIRLRVRELTHRIDDLYVDELRPELEKEGITLVDVGDLSTETRRELSERFDRDMFPVLTPLAVDPAHPFPYISNLSLNLAVVVRKNTGGLQFARVKVPPLLDRFIEAEPMRFVPIEQVIAHHVGRLFPGHEVAEVHAFRVTRSADLALEEEEADDLLEAMESVLRFRMRSASAVRLEVDAAASDTVVELLMRELELSPSLVYTRTTPLGLGDLFSLYDLDRSDLKEPVWSPTTSARLTGHSDGGVDFFAELNQGDILVHHPYESFATSTRAFLAQAARDPEVLAIKQTLYRTWAPDDPGKGGEEAIVQLLVDAAEAGKQVAVLVELKARFDEAANITWAKMLENAGVHVAYGVVGLKTHAKALLVVRREHGALRRYAHVGTGNYNPKTARLYEDVAVFTDDPDIGEDLSDLFNALTGYGTPHAARRLIVAPETLRSRLTERIREEGSKGAAGHIMFKINHLVDPEMIGELYAASQQGCPVELVVRGICSLRPQIPGLSDNITVRSIVGRYLEHSRIYRFGTPENGAVYYIGSADLMQRNLDGRVESLVPVVDIRLQARLQEILDAAMADDVLSWELSDETWTKVPVVAGINAHEVLRQAALDRSVDGSA